MHGSIRTLFFILATLLSFQFNFLKKWEKQDKKKCHQYLTKSLPYTTQSYKLLEPNVYLELISYMYIYQIITASYTGLYRGFE